jgi:hypothetical protein
MVFWVTGSPGMTGLPEKYVIDEVLIITGGAFSDDLEARRRGVKVETISNKPKTLVSYI